MMFFLAASLVSVAAAAVDGDAAPLVRRALRRDPWLVPPSKIGPPPEAEAEALVLVPKKPLKLPIIPPSQIKENVAPDFFPDYFPIDSDSNDVALPCACSPRSFEVTLDYSNDCGVDTLEANAGILDTACLVFDAVGQPLPSPDYLDARPSFVDEVIFVEWDRNDVVINDVRDARGFADGASLNLTSIADSLDPDTNLKDQLDLVPAAAALILAGRDTDGNSAVFYAGWEYDQAYCRSGSSSGSTADTSADAGNERVIGAGDELASAIFGHVEDALGEFCPRNTDPAPDPTPRPTPGTSMPTYDPTEMPTLSPSTESPTHSPSTESPTNSPSTDTPTHSPSTETPTFQPSISGQPSSIPSEAPSISTLPSSRPSEHPSVSDWPTSQPSSTPSSQPSTQPSMTTMPSGQPSENPSVSDWPSTQPSESPSLSERPSYVPSPQPSTQPSTNPSISAAPSSFPSKSPSVTTKPSPMPSNEPSRSALPSSIPSARPSSHPPFQPSPTGRTCPNDQKITVNITTDRYPRQTSWVLRNKCTGAIVARRERGYYTEKYKTYPPEEFCVGVAEFKFRIRDYYGNGMCCRWGEGSYAVSYDGSTVEGGDFDYYETRKIGCCPDPTVSPTLYPTQSPTSPDDPDTETPTRFPSVSPTLYPTQSPTSPDDPDTETPTLFPSVSPTLHPTQSTIPDDKRLVTAGNNWYPSSVFPLGECEGECDGDMECAGDLVCFLREGTEAVPGCEGVGVPGYDYCAVRPAHYLAYVAESGVHRSKFPLGPCDGDCDHDEQCGDGLVCFHRSGNTPVPGCIGEGLRGKDYCTYELTDADDDDRPLGLCEGDCDDDGDCGVGLACYQRNGFRAVPGCAGSGTRNKDYCIREDP